MPITTHIQTLAVCLIIVIVWLWIVTNRQNKQENRMANTDEQIAELQRIQSETKEAVEAERTQVRAELGRLENVIKDLENANQQPNIDLSGPIAEAQTILNNVRGIYEPAAPVGDTPPIGEDEPEGAV